MVITNLKKNSRRTGSEFHMNSASYARVMPGESKLSCGKFEKFILSKLILKHAEILFGYHMSTLRVYAIELICINSESRHVIVTKILSNRRVHTNRQTDRRMLSSALFPCFTKVKRSVSRVFFSIAVTEERS